MIQDRFRVGKKLIKIERTVEPLQARPLRQSMPGNHSWRPLRHPRETVWYIFLDGSRIGIAQKLPNGFYTCHRYVERDLRLLTCRLIDEDPKTIEELSAP